MAKADSSINARTAPDQVLLDIADYVLDYKVADERSFDTVRLCVTDSLACAFDALTKAYEIQGRIAIENDFFHQGSDHNLLVRVVTTAVLTRNRSLSDVIAAGGQIV